MPDFPQSAVESIRTLYPRKVAKGKELERIREALDRICEGEIDGRPRTPEEAVLYLRRQVEIVRGPFLARTEKYIPHLTTFMHQSRYLIVKPNAPIATLEEKNKLEDAYEILSKYPGIRITPTTMDVHLTLLQLIDSQIKTAQTKRPDLPREKLVEWFVKRVGYFAYCVSNWPEGERQFVPSAKRFFEEERWANEPATWIRTAKAGYESEREQTRRILE
jgi:hypothetical protein